MTIGPDEILVTSRWLRWFPWVATKLNRAPVDAITLGGRTYFWRNSEDPALRRHEAKHREQQRHEGWRFYPRYLWRYSTKGYHGNVYEIEARKAEEEVS